MAARSARPLAGSSSLLTPGRSVPDPAPVPTASATPEAAPSVNTDGAVTLLTPKSFLDAELGNILRPDWLTLDLITIGIVRDAGSAELLLPNISDRDY